MTNKKSIANNTMPLLFIILKINSSYFYESLVCLQAHYVQ